VPFNINEFNAEINKHGIVKATNFDVSIFGPVADGDAQRRMQMRCLETPLPGRQAQTQETSYWGPNKKYATGVLYNDITLRFILSEDFKEMEYFEKWMDKIVGKHRKGNPGPNMYDLGFYVDYVGTIEITTYNDVGKVKRTTTLIEAWPLNIGVGVQLSWQNGQEILTYPVDFCFKYYKTK
jgi:hypothetical protein